MDIYTPRKTEYKGVVFKSKSEAIVARSMDLVGLLWEYEPYQTKCNDGYICDFWVIVPASVVNDGRPSNWFQNVFIEYKPSIPTNTYLNEIYDRFKTLGLKRNPTIWILYGNPFDDTVQSGWLAIDVYDENHLKRKWRSLGPSFLGVIDKWHEAKKYRFDLKK